MGADSILIHQTRIIDPSRNLDESGDILIEAGKIAATGHAVSWWQSAWPAHRSYSHRCETTASVAI